MNDAAVCAYACVYVCFPTYLLARQRDGSYRSECHQNQSPVEQRGDGIPPQAAINPTRRDTLIFCGLYSIQGTMQGKVVFFFFSQYASLL